jgi:hypothetical protein
MKHVIIDCETLGQPVENCAVIDFSFMTVDYDRFLSDPYTTDDIKLVKKFKLSVKDQVDNYGWKVYKDTVEFWQQLPKAVRKNILPKETDLTIPEFINQLCSYMNEQGKIDYWWSRSNTFDPVILARIFDAEKKHFLFKEYFPFWKVRDIRTYIDAKLDFPKKNAFIPIKDEEHWKKVFIEHDSSWDVLADVLRMQAIVRAENDLELI